MKVLNNRFKEKGVWNKPLKTFQMLKEKKKLAAFDIWSKDDLIGREEFLDCT